MITTRKSPYDESVDRWALMRAAIAGEDAMKGYVGTYDPRSCIPDFIPREDKRYQRYIKRAVYYNFTGWTHAGLLGSVFRRPEVVEIPETLGYLEENADGTGLGLNQLARRVVSETLAVARVGLLVDADAKEEGGPDVEAKILVYHAEDIRDPRVEVIGGKEVLTMVILAEKRVTYEGFKTKEEDVYRVLALDEDGIYYQQMYDDNLKDPLSERVYPTDYNRAKLTRIPFHFIGAEDNRPTIDKPPLLDIAFVGCGHFRNSAAYEESLYYSAAGTYFISSKLSVKQWKELYPNGKMPMGNRAVNYLGAEGKATLLQSKPVDALKTALEDKVTLIIGLGGRFIRDSGGGSSTTETATGRRINEAQQNSGLSTLVGNCSAGIRAALMDAQLFMAPLPAEIEYTLNQDFFDADISPQEATALTMFGDNAYLAPSDVRRVLRRAGLIKVGRSDEDIDAEIANEF